MSVTAVDDAAVESVFDAVADERWDFRTVDGIARETTLDPELIRHILDTRTDLFRRSFVNTEGGKTLYTLANRPEKLRERLAEIQQYLARR
jgi:hypothetical protein